MEILGLEIKLNDLVQVIYVDNNNLQHIKVGRVFTFTNKYLYIDHSDDFVSLDDVIKIKIKNIQHVRKVDTTFMWR